VFLDLMAACDTVWHTGLLAKLSRSLVHWLTWLVELPPHVTAFLRLHMCLEHTAQWSSVRLSLGTNCSTCIWMTFQLHVAANSYTLMTSV